MLQRLFRWKSPPGPGARLSILIFHRVLPSPDPLFPDEVDARRFDAICGWLKGWFNVLSLDDAVVRLRDGSLPARAACITFDDGYADNRQIAMPILQRHGLNATFFIATGFLDGGCMWNDVIIESVRRTPLKTWQFDDLTGLGLGSLAVDSMEEKRAAIQAIIGKLKYHAAGERAALAQRVAVLAQVRVPGDLMMTSTELRSLRHAGMTIGAHTVSHPILAALPAAQARAEILASRSTLESVLDERIGLFAYPNGKPNTDYSTETVGIVRELGFDAAVTTEWASSGTGDDLFQIPRFTPWDHGRLRFGARLIANLGVVRRSSASP